MLDVMLHRLTPLLLLPSAGVAWAQAVDATPTAADALGAAAILATLGPLSWRLMGVVEGLVRQRVTGATGAPPPTPGAISIQTLVDDRATVLDAARQTGEVWRVTAQPNTDGQPRLLHQQQEVTRQLVAAESRMARLEEQVGAVVAAQHASTAATASLVAVLRELLTMSPMAAAARRAGTEGR